MTKCLARKRMAVALRCIKEQFPETPECMLMFAVIERAAWDIVDDHVEYHDRVDAVRYIKTDLSHAAICGIDKEWARGLIEKALMVKHVGEICLPSYKNTNKQSSQ